jgi:hypothetical protein
MHKTFAFIDSLRSTKDPEARHNAIVELKRYTADLEREKQAKTNARLRREKQLQERRATMASGEERLHSLSAQLSALQMRLAYLNEQKKSGGNEAKEKGKQKRNYSDRSLLRFNCTASPARDMSRFNGAGSHDGVTSLLKRAVAMSSKERGHEKEEEEHDDGGGGDDERVFTAPWDVRRQNLCREPVDCESGCVNRVTEPDPVLADFHKSLATPNLGRNSFYGKQELMRLMVDAAGDAAGQHFWLQYNVRSHRMASSDPFSASLLEEHLHRRQQCNRSVRQLASSAALDC